MTNIQQMNPFDRPDPALTNKIITHLKSQGIFDQFRRECMADVDTKPAYQNLRQRVEGSVAAFLKQNPWRPDMNKNQLRDNLRKHIQSGGFLDMGVDRIVDQVVNPKIYTVFLPKVEEVVNSCLGIENGKPKFEPPPCKEVKSESSNFEDKRNLAPRAAKLPAPLMGPTVPSIETLKQTIKTDNKGSTGNEKLNDHGSPDNEETSDKSFVVDGDDTEVKDEEDEDDEESPPFEPHTENERLILGVRSDSSENSNDSQVVTTIVDDSLEEKIDSSAAVAKEESEKKVDDEDEEEESSSDEYVPKTPTINMDETDGSVVEFGSVNEYKQYQAKYDDESFCNVEEVVSSQWVTEDTEQVKEERTSTEEDSACGSRKRKFNVDSYDEASSSSIDKGNTSDEGKIATFDSFPQKNYKFGEYEHENETSEHSVNEGENDDSFTEQSFEMTDVKTSSSDNEYQTKHKNRSNHKESGKSHSSHHKDHKESSSHHRDKNKEHTSSHSVKDKKDIHKKHDNHNESRDRHKHRERKKSESSHRHSEKSSKSKYHEKDTKTGDLKSGHNTEYSKKEKDNKEKKDSRLEHKDNHEHKSKDNYDRDKKKHSSQDRHSDGKRSHSSSHKHDKDKRENSKHSHSSSKHSHRSSEKHKSDKDHKHKESSDRHKSSDKKSDKDKEDSKRKHREHCKNNEKDENRRSSDRDSSGPGSRSHLSISSKSASSRSHKESKSEISDRTTSNSDNTVSDNIESLQNNDSKSESIIEQGIASPDPEQLNDSWNQSSESDWNYSKEDHDKSLCEEETRCANDIKLEEETKNKKRENGYGMIQFSKTDITSTLNQNPKLTTNSKESCEKSDDVKRFEDIEQNHIVPNCSPHDSSSEKENFDHMTPHSNIEDNNASDSSSDVDSKIVKFKKPKIAANIFEVKKIMQARRHMKRMEKKRIKLLIMKNNTEGSESEEKSSSDRVDECKTSQDEMFRGFEDVPSDKIVKYDCLIQRLSNELSALHNSINHEIVNGSLLTAWMEISPDLDDYIENTLKGKVHRKYLVSLPPVCDEFYTYDPEQKVYFYENNVFEQKEEIVDNNLNNLNASMKCQEMLEETFKSEEKQHMSKTLCNKNPTKRRGTCVNEDQANDGTSVETDITVEVSPKSKSRKVSVSSPEESISKNDNDQTPAEKINTENKKSHSNEIIAPIYTRFSLTFDQTYDEVLKEKAQNSVVTPKKDANEVCKQRTVVKITNNKTSEQVIMKTVPFQQISPDEDRTRDAKTESAINGKILQSTPVIRKMPHIRRVSKTKNVSVPLTVTSKPQRTNGIMSPDSTTNLEDEIPLQLSQKIINDVIGIQSETRDQDNVKNTENSHLTEVEERKTRRVSGCRQAKRYDSSDLYKPRLQLQTRRTRTSETSPESPPPTPAMRAARKRSLVTLQETSAAAKRRR